MPTVIMIASNVLSAGAGASTTPGLPARCRS
jgi:hypothetical protein